MMGNGVIAYWADECLIGTADQNQVTIATGRLFYGNGQSWSQDEAVHLEIPNDGEWYSVVARLVPVWPGGWRVQMHIYLGLSWDYDSDKIVLAGVRNTKGEIEIADRRSFIRLLDNAHVAA